MILKKKGLNIHTSIQLKICTSGDEKTVTHYKGMETNDIEDGVALIQKQSPDFLNMWQEIVQNHSVEECVGDKTYVVCNDKNWKWLCEELGKGTDGCQLANPKANKALNSSNS